MSGNIRLLSDTLAAAKAENRAACLPESMPEPPASSPTSRTSASSMKRWKMPIALEPPPTHAHTASGSRPVSSSTCARAS